MPKSNIRNKEQKVGEEIIQNKGRKLIWRRRRRRKEEEGVGRRRRRK
jgi:hypothetical protein